MKQYEDLLLEKDKRVAILTLNAPDKMNALTEKMKGSLVSALDTVAKDDEIRVVIVTGAGRAFSAGGDIEAMKARLDGKLEESRYERLQRVGWWGDILMKLSKPVIGAINGAAVGAGFALALSCDIRVASDKAKFGSVFILRGLVPDSGTTYFLPRSVGTSKALELMFTGEVFDAVTAKSLGIVSRVVPPDDLMKVCRELADRIAQQPPVALELTKRLVYRNMLDEIEQHLDRESAAQQMCRQTEDHRASVLAFLEKRPPPEFKGK